MRNKINPLPSKEMLDELLIADFDTGKLYWKERDAKWFKDQRSANSWNTRFSKTNAFTSLTRNNYLFGLIFGKSLVNLIWLTASSTKCIMGLILIKLII